MPLISRLEYPLSRMEFRPESVNTPSSPSQSRVGCAGQLADRIVHEDEAIGVGIRLLRPAPAV